MSSNVELVQLAKLAEQAERYEDMVNYMKEYTKSKKLLLDDHRNLLSVAFKNVVGARRSAWRMIRNIEDKRSAKSDKEGADLAGKYRKDIEKELEERCHEVLALIKDDLMPALEENKEENSVEAKVFYLKMKGDYYRYLVEVKTDSDRSALANDSNEAYKMATEAAADLPNTHPIRLGLALNYSVFHYEIMNDGANACKLAKKAFDDAIEQIDSLGDDTYKDSTLIMQLLRDNLTLWTSEQEDEETEKNE